MKWKKITRIRGGGNDMLEKIVEKLTSGKFLLTIMVGISFLYATFTKLLSPEAVATIITMVFISYFQKDKGGK